VASVGYFVSTIDLRPVRRWQRRSERSRRRPSRQPPPCQHRCPRLCAVHRRRPRQAGDTPAAESATAETAQAADSQAAPVNGTPNPAPLQRNDVRRSRRSCGPLASIRPVDGNPGRMTEGAVRLSTDSRAADRRIDNALLQQFRQDPAPLAVQQVRPAGRPAGPLALPRRSDPFEPACAAGNRFGQWMNPWCADARRPKEGPLFARRSAELPATASIVDRSVATASIKEAFMLRATPCRHCRTLRRNGGLRRQARRPGAHGRRDRRRWRRPGGRSRGQPGSGRRGRWAGRRRDRCRNRARTLIAGRRPGARDVGSPVAYCLSEVAS
jgi:hypothetical protein